MTMAVEIKNADPVNSLHGLRLTGGTGDGVTLAPQESYTVYIHSGTDSNVMLSEVPLVAKGPAPEVAVTVEVCSTESATETP